MDSPSLALKAKLRCQDLILWFLESQRKVWNWGERGSEACLGEEVLWPPCRVERMAKTSWEAPAVVRVRGEGGLTPREPWGGRGRPAFSTGQRADVRPRGTGRGYW